MKFTKYQGLGNDFIIIDENLEKEQVIKLCDRHFGIGADGLIINSIHEGIPYMKFFNSDGSVAKMCGNGIRCYADYLNNKGLDFSKIYTLSGIKEIEKIGDDYRVFMGKAEEKFLDKEFLSESLNSIYTGTNHCIIVSDKDLDYLNEIGPIIEKNTELFKDGTNINLVKVIDNNNIRIYTYERGVGITLACGTGACASAYLTNLKGYTGKLVNVNLLGGNLKIELSSKGIYMIGSAKKVFEGEI